MDGLERAMSSLPQRQKSALAWFLKNAGAVQAWPKPIRGPEGETLLVCKAKGIYKPKWSQYALSVRQAINSPYPDRTPELRKDGTWMYLYHEESDESVRGKHEYTNEGLRKCLQDHVPIGVLRQISKKPDPKYEILGLAFVTAWDNGFFTLEGYGTTKNVVAASRGVSEIDGLFQREQEKAEKHNVFDPKSVRDARQRAIRQMVQRRGQPQFRKRLLEIYGGRCAVTGCNVEKALEAVHIVPYKGSDTNHISNGLLLRADLHILFDCALIAIDPSNMRIVMSPMLAESSYSDLAGKSLVLPADSKLHPSAEALSWHLEWTGLR